jgi:hypothetical protein
MRRTVVVTIDYTDGTSSRLKVPVNAIATFISGLVPEVVRM